MSKVSIAPATQADVDALAPVMRKADVDELNASIGLSPEKALVFSVNVSDVAWAGYIDGDIAAIGGVAQTSLLGGCGSPWLLGSDVVTANPVPFLRHTRRMLAEIRSDYLMLENYVDARNIQSIRWLQWLGFEMEPAAPFGVSGRPFHHFWMNCEVF